MREEKRCIVMLVAACGGAALLLSGCAHASAKTAPEPPALDMPAPPPRSVDTAETEPLLPPEAPLPQEPARTPIRPRPTPPVPPRAEVRTPETPKAADVPAAEPARPAEEAPKPSVPAASALQTTPTGSEADIGRSIHATITRATADLNHVDYRALNADAREQYETAKRFIQQAEEAVRQKNLVFAKNLAEKAAALAAQLAGR